MIGWLQPLRVNVVLEERPYKLGETIYLTVDLRPKRDVEITGARVDLMCEERYTETLTVMVMPRHGGGGPTDPPSTVPREGRRKRRESYLHSSAVFLENASLGSGTFRRYDVKLDIQPEPPSTYEARRLGELPLASTPTVKWSLVTSIDVAGARTIQKRHKVEVIFT